jgi:mono/diheme cytochrome c family protein
MRKRLLCFLVLSTSVLAPRFAAAQDADAASHAAAGEHLFKQNCSACHSTAPGEKIVGPSLHAEMKGPTPKKTAAQVKTTIMNGNGTMPAFKTMLTPADIENLVAYLKTQ